MDLRLFLDSLNIYSMFDFYDGRNEPGMLVSRFNTSTGREEYRFVPQAYMQSYREAFEKFDRAACDELSERVDPEDILEVRSVSLADFKRALERQVERMVGVRKEG